MKRTPRRQAPRGPFRHACSETRLRRGAFRLVFGRLGRDRHDIYHGVTGLSRGTARALRSGGARGARGRSDHGGRGGDNGRIGRRNHRSFTCAEGKGPDERDRHKKNFHDGFQCQSCYWKALHLMRAARAARAGPYYTGITIIGKSQRINKSERRPIPCRKNAYESPQWVGVHNRRSHSLEAHSLARKDSGRCSHWARSTASSSV